MSEGSYSEQGGLGVPAGCFRMGRRAPVSVEETRWGICVFGFFLMRATREAFRKSGMDGEVA